MPTPNPTQRLAQVLALAFAQHPELHKLGPRHALGTALEQWIRRRLQDPDEDLAAYLLPELVRRLEETLQ